jgi:hypothetical protein
MTRPVPLTPVPNVALQHMLATERDAHRRQRELVRASLFSCPGKRG